MRELTLEETGFLAAFLLVSLLLPLLMSFRNPQDPVRRRSCMKTVWMGQAVVAVAAVAVLASARFAPYGTALGLVSWAGFAFVLIRQFRVTGISAGEMAHL